MNLPLWKVNVTLYNWIFISHFLPRDSLWQVKSTGINQQNNNYRRLSGLKFSLTSEIGNSQITVFRSVPTFTNCSNRILKYILACLWIYLSSNQLRGRGTLYNFTLVNSRQFYLSRGWALPLNELSSLILNDER